MSRFRNIFLWIGVVAVVVMLLTFDMSWKELCHHVRQSGMWLPAAILLWLPIYIINARAWQLIVNDGETRPVGFWRIFKYTVSGYALNSVTPVGLLGGEPYRIMELSPLVGRARAASSVILYAMMHIFSHFCFWLFSVGLFLWRYGHALSWPLAAVLGLILLFCLAGGYVFLVSYRHGLVLRLLSFLGRWPFVGAYVCRQTECHAEGIREVDKQIAALHAQRRTTFYCSLSLEFVARMLGCLELQFILFALTREVSYWDCVLMQAFASLFANLFFFIPMQMGTKEGGLALVTECLHISGAYGVLTGLVTRLRELFWIAVGLLLIRIGDKKAV